MHDIVDKYLLNFSRIEISGKNVAANNTKISPTKKSPMKINNNLKVSPPSKSLKSSPARTPTKSIKSHKPIAESTPVINSSDKNNNQQQKTTKETSEAKSFISFTENLDENLNEDASVLEQEEAADMNKSEGIEIVIE